MTKKTLTVLLVEDDPAHAEIVRRNFRDFSPGNRLEHVSDGVSALNYIYRRGIFAEPGAAPRPDLVLLDLRLPGVDGLTVLRTVKEDPHLAPIPVVILTTSAAEADVVQAYENQANSYLIKPADFDEFISLMESLELYWLKRNFFPEVPEKDGSHAR